MRMRLKALWRRLRWVSLAEYEALVELHRVEQLVDTKMHHRQWAEIDGLKRQRWELRDALAQLVEYVHHNDREIANGERPDVFLRAARLAVESGHLGRFPYLMRNSEYDLADLVVDRKAGAA